MDTPPHPPNRKRIKLLVALALVVVIGVALYLLLAPSEPKIVWLTPAQLAKDSQPGMLVQLKRKLVHYTAPLWSWHHPHHPQVLIDSTTLQQPPEAATLWKLGTPISTNADGIRAWIISPEEYIALTNHLLSSMGKFSLHAVLPDGTPTLASLNSIVYSRSVTITPKISSHSVQLDLSDFMPKPLATRVLLPDGGAVVIDRGPIVKGSRNDDWLIVSPTILDANGNPIKP